MKRAHPLEKTIVREAATELTNAAVTQLERPPVRDGLDVLIDFHDEIRLGLKALERLAAGEDVDVPALRAFLEGPLVWHDEDEEVTIIARLRRRRIWDEDLAHVVAGHEKLEDILDELTPLLSEPVVHRAAIADAAARLPALLVGHMKLEEERLFPLVRRVFDVDELADMAAEVRARHERRRVARRTGR